MLTDKAIRALKPIGRPYKRGDSKGLYLYVTTEGARLWRVKYRLGGKERLLSLGSYPDLSLSAAREGREEARAWVKAGLDPVQERKRRRSGSAESFQHFAHQWHALMKPRWAAHHAAEVLSSLERYALPGLGSYHVNSITAPMVLDCLRAVEARGAREMAHRLRQRMSAIFLYAVSCGVGVSDPAAVVKGALQHVEKGKQPAIIDLDELKAMLRRVEVEPAFPQTQSAIRWTALTACRPGEVRGARWEELEGLDGEEPVWRVPGPRMKEREEHVVPLAPAAVKLARALHVYTGNSEYLFPNSRRLNTPLAENCMNYHLYRCGYHGKHCPHGFRSALSSILNERHPDQGDVIEAILAHKIDGVRGDYNRATYFYQRKPLMAEWAELILGGAPDAETLLSGRRR